MKILLVAGLAESLINFRGALIAAMQTQGIEVHVAAPDLAAAAPTRLALQARGVVVHDIAMHRTGLNPILDLQTLWCLWRLMWQIQPDAMLAYTVKPVIYGNIAAWLAGVPKRFALITGLGYAFTGQARGLRSVVQTLARILYKIALRHAHKVFFQNPDDQALFRQLNLIPAHVPSLVVNGSGVDVASFQCTPLPQGACRFLMIARLLGDKGVREYAAAAKLVKDKHPETSFELVGWIDENPNAITQSELDQWVQSGVIQFHGRMTDVRPAIANCTVYVLPSYREGTPRTVLEAMAMGRPIITTDAPGCRETVIDQHNGLLVPVKSIQDLAHAMECFVCNSEMAAIMGRQSRKLAEEKYDVIRVNMQMMNEMSLQNS